MEDRIAYLKVALQLRLSSAIPQLIHPHSGLSKGLLLRAIESEINVNLNIGYITAWAGLSSHSKVDVTGALAGFPKVFSSVKRAIPYMRHLEADSDPALDSAVKRWKEMNDAGEFGAVEDNKD